MPEFSSTTIIPADAVQLPAVNGNTTGNFNLQALTAYILASKGQPNGLASLGADGRLSSTELPLVADDVLVYDAVADFPETGEEGKLYIAKTENKIYYYNSTSYVEITSIVQSITDGDTDHAPSADAVYGELSLKADESDLTAEATARQSADANIQKQIDRHDKQIENLNEVVGDYSSVRYQNAPSGVVPTGKAKYAELSVLRGVTRGWNQLASEITAEHYNFNNASGSISDGVANFTATANQARIASVSGYFLKYVPNHYYYVSVKAYASATRTLRFQLNVDDGSYFSKNFTSTASTIEQTFSDIFNPTTGTAGDRWFAIAFSDSVDGDTFKLSELQIVDLTLLFGSGNEPSTVAEALARIPQLGQYNPYDAGGLVSTTYSGVKSRGVNICESYTSSGFSSAGANALYATGELKGDTQYTISFVGTSGARLYTNENLFTSTQHFLVSGSRQSVTITTMSSVDKSTATQYDTTYGWRIFKNSSGASVACSFADVQIEEGSTATTYHPYMTTTLSLPSPVTLRSAGSVADELDVKSGVVTRNVGMVDLGTLDWVYHSSGNMYVDDAVSDRATSAKAICARYVQEANEARGVASLETDYAFCFQSNLIGRIIVRDTNYTNADTFKSAMSGVYLYYELATPTTESIGTTDDNFIKTEGGGTLTPTQTQDPEIDTDFTAEFIAIGA